MSICPLYWPAWQILFPMWPASQKELPTPDLDNEVKYYCCIDRNILLSSGSNLLYIHTQQHLNRKMLSKCRVVSMG